MHLRTIKVTQTRILTEKDLILACTGQFNDDGTNMTIYSRHRVEHACFGDQVENDYDTHCTRASINTQYLTQEGKGGLSDTQRPNARTEWGINRQNEGSLFTFSSVSVVPIYLHLYMLI